MKTKNNHAPKNRSPFTAQQERLQRLMEEIHNDMRKPVDPDDVFKAQDRGEAYCAA